MGHGDLADSASAENSLLVTQAVAACPLSEKNPSAQPAAQQARVPCHKTSFHVALTGPCWLYQPRAGGTVEPGPLWLLLRLSDEQRTVCPVAAQSCSVCTAHTQTSCLLQPVMLD